MGVGNWMSRNLAGSSRHRPDTVSGDPLRRLMPRSWKHRSGNDTGCLASYYKGHMMKKYKSVDTPEKREGWDPHISSVRNFYSHEGFALSLLYNPCTFPSTHASLLLESFHPTYTPDDSVSPCHTLGRLIAAAPHSTDRPHRILYLPL